MGLHVVIHDLESSRIVAHIFVDQIPRKGEILIMPNAQWEVVGIRHEFEITDYQHIVPGRRMFRQKRICLEVRPWKD